LSCRPKVCPLVLENHQRTDIRKLVSGWKHLDIGFTAIIAMDSATKWWIQSVEILGVKVSKVPVKWVSS
jgi:hypothetical protein